LTTIAIHEAWRLNRIDRRAGAFDPATPDAISIQRERAVAAAHDVAEQHMRLELVAQIPSARAAFAAPRAGLQLRRDLRSKGRRRQTSPSSAPP
jgi:hypothetical protein